MRTDTDKKPTGGIRRFWEWHHVLPKLGLYHNKEEYIPYDYDDMQKLGKAKHYIGLLDNPDLQPDSKKYAFTIWPDNRWNYNKTIMGYSVKDGRFNYVEWVKLNTGEVLEKELYDHQTDPKETKNVIADEQYQNVIAALAAKCEERKDATDHNHGFKSLR